MTRAGSPRAREAVGTAAVGEALAQLREHDWAAQARRLVERTSHVQVSKFQPCLPEELEVRLLVERLADVEGTRRFIHDHRAPVIAT